MFHETDEAGEAGSNGIAGRIEAVVLGASAGAIEALSVVLPELPAGYGLPVMVVVHLPPDRDSVIAELFRQKCQVQVKEAEDKEPIQPGTVYFAPPDYHLLVEQGGHLSLSSDEPVHFSRPSIDVLLETAADVYGERLLAIILTGASHDGAGGLQRVCQEGGSAVVQEPDTAYMRTMPDAALAACPEATALPLEEIAVLLKKLCVPGPYDVA